MSKALLKKDYILIDYIVRNIVNGHRKFTNEDIKLLLDYFLAFSMLRQSKCVYDEWFMISKEMD